MALAEVRRGLLLLKLDDEVVERLNSPDKLGLERHTRFLSSCPLLVKWRENRGFFCERHISERRRIVSSAPEIWQMPEALHSH